MLEEVAAEHQIDRVGGNLLRQSVTRREDFLGPGRQNSSGQPLDIDGDPPLAPDVTQELTKPGADVEDDVVVANVALEEVRTQHLPDRILRAAVGFGKSGRVERIERQRIGSRFLHHRLS